MSNVSKSLLQGAKEALDYAKGVKKGSKVHRLSVPKEIDVRAIREKLQMSRQEFSDNFGLSTRTLEKWEQGVRQPDDAAKLYLMVIAHHPKTVIKTLRAESSS